MIPVGRARFCTPRSWLSQWSYGDAVRCGPDIALPALVIGNLANDANQYYARVDQRDELRESVGIATDRLDDFTVTP